MAVKSIKQVRNEIYNQSLNKNNVVTVNSDTKKKNVPLYTKEKSSGEFTITTSGGARMAESNIVIPQKATQLKTSGLGDAGTTIDKRYARNSGYTTLQKSTVTLPSSGQTDTYSGDIETASDPAVEKVKTDLSTFASSLKKRAKYNQLSENMKTLSNQMRERSAAKSARVKRQTAWASGITSGLSLIATAINPVFGAIVGATGGLITTGIASDNDTSQLDEKATRFEQTMSDFLDYSEYLAQGDIIANNARESILGSLTGMRQTYGDAFTDQFYNLMLAKSGMTPDDYSLLTGNFRTYEQGMYGQVSGENGLFDELTQGADFFNNMYAQLTSNDLESIKTSLTQALFAGDTEIGEQLRGYENDLNVMFQNYITGSEASMSQLGASLAQTASNRRAEEINAAESIGGAEAQRASSGLRGGTSGANVALARLSADLNRISSLASASSALTQMMASMRQQQLNASSTAYNYRSAQRQMKISTFNAAINTTNSVGRTAQEAERQRNLSIENARVTEERINKVLEGMDADETDILLEGLGM